MKIGVISDLHIDMNERKLSPRESYDKLLAEILYHNEVDTLLLAGDISSDYHDSIKFLDKLKSHNVSKTYFVPGNHDFWSIRNKATDTNRIYETFKDREDSVVGRPIELTNQHSLVANPGWYDYGFASDKYTQKEFAEKKLSVGGWNDRLYVHWEGSDKEVASNMLHQIEQDIEAVNGKDIILMTHVATHDQFVVPLPNKIYDYYNAYLGSKSYMELYDKYPITHSIMGHVHFRKTLQEGGTTYYCACLGNGRHWYHDDPRIELAYTLETFII